MPVCLLHGKTGYKKVSAGSFLFACALMSKPMVITLPIVMILLDYWPLDRLQSRKIVTNMPEVMPVSTNKGKKKNKLKKEALKKNISPPRSRNYQNPGLGNNSIMATEGKNTFFCFVRSYGYFTLYNPDTPDMSGTPFKTVSSYFPDR